MSLPQYGQPELALTVAAAPGERAVRTECRTPIRDSGSMSSPFVVALASAMLSPEKSTTTRSTLDSLERNMLIGPR